MRKLLVALALLMAFGCSSPDPPLPLAAPLVTRPTPAPAAAVDLADNGGLCQDSEICDKGPFRLRVGNASRSEFKLQDARSAESALTVFPGDTLFFQVATVNTGQTPFFQVEARVSLPEGISFGDDPSLKNIFKSVSYVSPGSYHYFLVTHIVAHAVRPGTLLQIQVHFSWSQGETLDEAWIRVGERSVDTTKPGVECPDLHYC
jgi:hypothetical protein